jgi:predicted small secreted protein
MNRVTRWLLLILILVTFLLGGCINSEPGIGFDLMKLLRNPVVILIIGGVAVWFAFKGSKKD